jgi:hypothetical protein
MSETKKLTQDELLKQLDNHVYSGLSEMVTKFKEHLSKDEIENFELLKPYSGRIMFTFGGSRDINLLLEYLVRFGSDLIFQRLKLGDLSIKNLNELTKLTTYMSTSPKLKELSFGLEGERIKDSSDEIIRNLFLSIAMSETLESLSFQDNVKWGTQHFQKFCYATCLVPTLKYLTLKKSENINYRDEDAIIASIRNGMCVTIASTLLVSQIVRILVDYLEKARYWISIHKLNVDGYHIYLKDEIEKENGETLKPMSLDMFERPKPKKARDGTWFVTQRSKYPSPRRL